MEEEKPRVLIVDDSRGDIRIVNENLKELYTTLAATDGEKALAIAVKDPKPDLILMDVEMPGMNGYETCQKLKSNPETADIDVIFVSAHDTVDEIVAGYDAGGTDYLTKPIEPQELKKKIKIAIDNRRRNNEISSERLSVEKIAFTAMNSAGEQGVVMGFLKSSFTVKHLEELADLIVSTVDTFDLVNTVQIRTKDKVIDRASSNTIIPLEQELLTRLKDQSRIIEKGQRAIFNFGEVSLLIKNICEDRDKWGRLKDNLSLLLEGAVAKYESISFTDRVSSVIESSKKSLAVIEEEQKAHKKQSQDIVDKMLINLEESYNSLGLLNTQEEMLTELVQGGVNESLAHHEKGMHVDIELRKIISKLTSL